MKKKANQLELNILLCLALGVIFLSLQFCKKEPSSTYQAASLGISVESFSPAWSPDGDRIIFSSRRDAQNSEIYIMNLDGTNQIRLTHNAIGDGSPSWSPDGNRIVFQSNRDGNSEIYLMNADGSDQTRLTDNNANDGSPSWSPDGKRIVFGSNRDGNWEIYTMNPGGTDQIRLTHNAIGDGSPSWSPDGKRIVFVSGRDGNSEIYTMNVDGSNHIRLTDNPAIDSVPCWSPDGLRIVFASNRDGYMEIYTMNAIGSDLKRLTDESTWDSSPSWSPDGRKIVFISDRDFICEVYLMNPDGSNQVNLTNNAPFDATFGSAPLTQSELDLNKIPYRIVYESFRETNGKENWEICLIDADGSDFINLTNTPEIDELSPLASPDGSLICFEAVEGKELEIKSRNIYIMKIDGTDRVKIAENAYYPCWSGDGRHIAYLPGEYPRYNPSRRANKGLEIYDLETNEKKRHPNEKIIHFSRPCWSPDGEWIVAVQRAIKAFKADGLTMITLSAIGCTPDISPDGKLLAWNSSDFHLNIGTLDFESPQNNVINHRVVVACEYDHWVYDADWSPDKNYLAFNYGIIDECAAVERAAICICELKTGKWTQITTDGIHNGEPDWVPVKEGE